MKANIFVSSFYKFSIKIIQINFNKWGFNILKYKMCLNLLHFVEDY